MNMNLRVFFIGCIFYTLGIGSTAIYFYVQEDLGLDNTTQILVSRNSIEDLNSGKLVEAESRLNENICMQLLAINIKLKQSLLQQIPSETLHVYEQALMAAYEPNRKDFKSSLCVMSLEAKRLELYVRKK